MTVSNVSVTVYSIHCLKMLKFTTGLTLERTMDAAAVITLSPWLCQVPHHVTSFPEDIWLLKYNHRGRVKASFAMLTRTSHHHTHKKPLDLSKPVTKTTGSLFLETGTGWSSPWEAWFGETFASKNSSKESRPGRGHTLSTGKANKFRSMFFYYMLKQMTIASYITSIIFCNSNHWHAVSVWAWLPHQTISERPQSVVTLKQY